MWGFLGYPALRFHIGIPRVPSIGVPLEIDGLGLDVGVIGVPSIGVPLETDGLGLDVGVLGVLSVGVSYWDSRGAAVLGFRVGILGVATIGLSYWDGWVGVGCGGPWGPQYWGSS